MSFLYLVMDLRASVSLGFMNLKGSLDSSITLRTSSALRDAISYYEGFFFGEIS